MCYQCWGCGRCSNEEKNNINNFMRLCPICKCNIQDDQRYCPKCGLYIRPKTGSVLKKDNKHTVQ